MGDAIVIPPGGGEVLGDSPDRRVETLSDRDELHATWSMFGPGREGAGLHIHHHHTDLFYVLEGELTVRLGIEDEQVAAGPGTLVRIPPMVVHGFRNASDAEVRYLNLHAPGGGFIGFMRGLRDGEPIDFDQDEPDAEGVLPASEAQIGGECDVEAISIEEVAGEPGAAAPQLADDRVRSFYVLEGEVEVAIDGEPVTAGAGTWVQVPPGPPVELAFPSPARVLTCRT